MKHTLKQSARAVGAMVAAVPLSIVAFIVVAICLILRQEGDSPFVDDFEDDDKC